MGDEQQPIWRRAATHTLHTSLILKASLEERLQEETGLLLADNEALLHLEMEGSLLRMSEIARRLILSRGGTTKVVDRLEAMGLVERQPDPDDRRATIVSITAAGREARAEVGDELAEPHDAEDAGARSLEEVSHQNYFTRLLLW